MCMALTSQERPERVLSSQLWLTLRLCAQQAMAKAETPSALPRAEAWPNTHKKTLAKTGRFPGSRHWRKLSSHELTTDLTEQRLW